MTSACPDHAGHRFPAETISQAVWLPVRLPLSLRMVGGLLAARGIIVSHETIRQWAVKFGQGFANQTRRKLPAAGDKRHLDGVVLAISGVKHWLRREALAVACGRPDRLRLRRTGVLNILVQSRRDTQAAKRSLRKLLKRQCRALRVMVTDKLASYEAAKREVMSSVEHRRHKGLNKGAENLLQPMRQRERQMKRLKSAGQTQRFLSAHDGISNLLHRRRHHLPDPSIEPLGPKPSSSRRKLPALPQQRCWHRV